MKDIINFKLPGGIILEYDPAAHAAYIRINSNAVARSEERSPLIIVDLDEKGMLVGIEVINPMHISIEARKTLNKVADEYNRPELKKIHPEAIPQVYAYA